MARLEGGIANPVAHPEQVAGLVAAMSSDTVSAPRNLSMPLRRRLDDIAGRHGGRIPLHGRLFAQWMHHAFPNECPYPHVTGALAAPLSPMEVILTENQTGLFLKASDEEMQTVLEAASTLNASDPLAMAAEPVLHWTEEEELWVGASVVPPSKGTPLLRRTMLGLALFSV